MYVPKPLLLLLLTILFLPLLHAEELPLYAVEFSAQNNSEVVTTNDKSFEVNTDGQIFTVIGFNNSAESTVGAGFPSNNDNLATITTTTPIPQKINRVTLDISSINASRCFSIRLFRSDSPTIPIEYIQAANITDEEAKKVYMGDFPMKAGLQTVEIESPKENQYYMITFDLWSKSPKNTVTLTGRCIEFYADVTSAPTPIEVRMFEQAHRFEWSPEIDLTDAIACVDNDGNPIDALSHLQFSIAPKEGATFASNPQRYTEEYMTTPYNSTGITPLSLLPTSDSWLYDFPNLDLHWQDNTSLTYTNSSILAKVPCSGHWTVTASIPDDDPHYTMAAPVTADLTIEPTFAGFTVNWLSPKDGALQFAPWSDDETLNGKYNIKNTRLDIDGFLYNIYYKINTPWEEDASITAAEGTDELQRERVGYRRITPQEAGYTLYAPTYDKTTDTVHGINLYGAKSVEFVLEKNGVSTLDPNSTNGAGQHFEITDDLVTALPILPQNETVDETATPTYYNLQGHRVDPRHLTPGLYLHRGQKIIVK